MTSYEPFVTVPQYQQMNPGDISERTYFDLDAASQAIRNYCGWHIWPSITESLVLDGSGTMVIGLPTLNLTAVTAFTETEVGSGQTPVTVATTDLEWSRLGLIWHVTRRCWTGRARGIATTVTHGFDYVPVLAALCADIAARSAASPAGVVRKQLADRSVTYSSVGGATAGRGFLRTELDALAPYRIGF